MGVWCHIPWSPNRVSCNYHLFSPLKQILGSQHIDTNDEVQETAQNGLKQIRQNFNAYGIERNLSRVTKSVQKNIANRSKNR